VLAQDAITAQVEIAKLRFQLARYRRAEFGRSSEKLEHEADQLELAIETLEADQAERIATASPFVAAAIEAAVEGQKPARRPLPDHLPREDVTHPRTVSGRRPPPSRIRRHSHPDCWARPLSSCCRAARGGDRQDLDPYYAAFLVAGPATGSPLQVAPSVISPPGTRRLLMI